MIQQGIDKGAGGMAGGGVHHQSRRLVDHHDIWVLVKDVERYGLRQEPGRLRGRDASADGIAGLQAITRLAGLTVDLDSFARNELAGKRP
jgi:hypothetical protein